MSEVCEGYNGSVRNLIIPERPCWGSCCFGELHTRNLLQSVGFGLQSEGMIRNASRACGAPFPNLLRAQPLVFIAGHPLTSRLVVQWRFCLSPVDPAPSFLLLLLKHKVDLGSDSRKGLEYSIYYGRETVKTFSTSFSGMRFSKLLALVYFHTPFFLCSCLSQCLSQCSLTMFGVMFPPLAAGNIRHLSTSVCGALKHPIPLLAPLPSAEPTFSMLVLLCCEII